MYLYKYICIKCIYLIKNMSLIQMIFWLFFSILPKYFLRLCDRSRLSHQDPHNCKESQEIWSSSMSNVKDLVSLSVSLPQGLNLQGGKKRQQRRCEFNIEDQNVQENCCAISHTQVHSVVTREVYLYIKIKCCRVAGLYIPNSFPPHKFLILWSSSINY